MGFFDDLSAPAVFEELSRPVDAPLREVVGTPTATRLVLVHAADVAVVLSRFVVSDFNGDGQMGISFDVSVHLRAYDEDLHRRVEFGFPMGAEPPDPGDPKGFRLGVQFADGRKVTNLDESVWLDEDGAPGLTPGGGGFGGNPRDGMKFSGDYFLTPLPPPGPLLFVCEWPALGISENSATVDAEVFRLAAESALTLWETPPRRDGR